VKTWSLTVRKVGSSKLKGTGGILEEVPIREEFGWETGKSRTALRTPLEEERNNSRGKMSGRKVQEGESAGGKTNSLLQNKRL